MLKKNNRFNTPPTSYEFSKLQIIGAVRLDDV